MKTLLTILSITCVLGFSQLSAQTYVHHGATGANDGSSWTDAYTSLKMAIDNAVYQEEIWVAAGTYLPDTTPNRETYFLMTKSVKLYGGFEGTETSFSERDPESNLTILSGDVSGNDITQANGNLLNRGDNYFHVLAATSGVDSTAIVDGFRFEGGYADGAINENKGGGAIIANGPLQIRNCSFYGNYAKVLGGAIYGVTTKGIQVTNCTFEKNKADNRGGGICFSSVKDGLVDSCVFVDNEAERSGGGFSPVNSSAIVTNSDFTENECLWGGGAINVIASASNNTVTIQNNTFSQNKSSAGGAVVIAVYGMSNTTEVLDCEFTDNRSRANLPPDLTTGGAIGILNYNRTGNTLNHILIENCLIKDNEGVNLGGGIGIFNEGGVGNSLIVRNCDISGNTAANSGGGVSLVSPSYDYNVRFERTIFDGNECSDAGGVFISRLNSNLTYSPDHDISFYSCLFANHKATNYVLGTHYMKASVFNGTFTDNGAPGLGVKIKGEFFLQNNILHNKGYRELAKVSVTKPAYVKISSGGGNVVADSTMDVWLGPDDLSEREPRFESGTYNLAWYSPAVGFGKFYPGFDPSEKDLAGNHRMRKDNIDAGAYESDFATSIKDLLVPHSDLKMYPIPVSNHANLELNNAWRGQLTMKIYNLLGQEVYKDFISKHQDHIRWQIDLSQLPAGSYRLILTDGNAASLKSFVKN